MREKKISIQNVSYQYPNREDLALKNISLDVNAGEILAIMGPTGAGKTSLVSTINGLIPHFFEGTMTGNIIVNQQSTYLCKIQELVEEVGLVLQDPETQIFGITVIEDTTFGPRNLAQPKQKVLSQAKEALKMVGLAGFENRNTKNLSGGEKQRLAIAGVLAMEPLNLILDEPVSELDPKSRSDILNLIEQLRVKKETTVLFVEHDPEFVLSLADRVAIIVDGELAWAGSPKDLFRDVPLTKSFSIRPPQITEFGYSIYQKGWISKEEIPLSINEAESTIKNLLGKSIKDIQFENIILEKNPKIESSIIEVTELMHEYPNGLTALREVNCNIYPGEMVAIIGQNGAGKSTFSKHLNGLLRPTSGIVKINGTDIITSSVQQMASQVGYVFQNPDHQIFSASVEEELRFGLKNLNLSEEDQNSRIEAALDFVGLREERDRHPFMLGKGQRQLVAVASILAVAPPIICIDEPTTGLDWQGSMKMMDLIARLNKKGHTILMITHNMRLVMEYTDRVLLLHEGELLCDDIPTNIFSDQELLQRSGLVPPPIAQLSNRLFENNKLHHIKTSEHLVKKLQSGMDSRGQ